MGRELVNKIIPTLNKTSWQGNEQVTQLGLQAFEVGLESVDEYRGDPAPLTSALRIFHSGDSVPFGYAGVAYVLIRASREDDGNYYQPGLDAAREWLEKAQELAPDTLQINMIEALIYIYGDRFDDARIVLDFLEQIDSRDYYVICAEAAFWRRQKAVNETIFWYGQAIDAAETVPKKLRLRSQLGDCYLDFGMNEEAARSYEEAVHFSKENPWLWHRLSVVNWRMENYEEALRCNKRALELEDFPEAREMERALEERLGTGSLKRRLFGR